MVRTALLILACAAAPEGRYSHVGGVVDGVLWSIGGAVSVTEPRAELWSLDLATLAWRRHADAPEAVYRATAAWDGGAFLVFGGDTGDAVSDHLWRFDPAGGTWEALATAPSPRFKPASTWMDGRLWVYGGKDADVLGELWSWDGARWEEHGDVGPLHRQSLVPMDDGTALMYAGIDDEGRTDAIWRLAGGALAPVDGGGGPDPRASHCAWGGERMLAWGGHGDDVALHASDGAAWTTLAEDGPPARDAAVCAADGDRLYVLGGDTFPAGLPDFSMDLWAWDGAGWTELLAPDGLPPG